MKPRKAWPALAAAFLLLTTASSTVYALDCACEVAAGACAQCCGDQNAGFKHCRHGADGPPPPAHANEPAPYYEKMPSLEGDAYPPNAGKEPAAAKKPAVPKAPGK